VHVPVCSCLVCTQWSARDKELQLLYADGTEEVVSGSHYDAMLANGHLLDVDRGTAGMFDSTLAHVCDNRYGLT
jgi:hypothetical protein